VKLIKTPEQLEAESNWGYYAMGGAAILGGLYFLTKDKDSKTNIEESLLH